MPDQFASSPGLRKEMVYLIEVLNSKKEYKFETFFIAVNIADRYLQALAEQGQEPPAHVLLGVTALMIAGKANESVRPSFEFTAALLPEPLQAKVSMERFIDLE